MAQILFSACDVQTSSDECISPVPELLGTNRVPSSTEAAAITQFLVNVYNEIRQLESVFPKPTARRDHLKSVVDSHRALLSPARRVPPEILSEIFSWSPGAPTQDPGVKLPDNFDPHHGPLLLTQVCRSWRQTTIAIPKLWSTIRFVLGPRSKVNLIDMWLERSRDFDLTIAILDRSSFDSEAIAVRDNPSNAEAIRCLASQAHRWKSVFLHLPPYTSYKVYWDALGGAKGNIGRLQRLTVHITRGESQLTMPDIFIGGPRLTSLTLNRLIPGDALPIDGSRITKFCYESSPDLGSSIAPIPECIKAMRRFANLKVCSLYCEVHSVTNVTDVTMANLERLNVKLSCGETSPSTSDPGTLWRALHLPNLKTFVAGSPDIRVQFHREEFPGLISRCSTLTTLVLAFATAQPQDLIEVLRKAPNVRNLQLMSDENLALVFTSISKSTTASQPDILPRLKMMRVTLSVDIGRHLSDELLATWVPMALGRMDTTLEDSGKDLLRSAILDLRQQESLRPRESFQYLRDYLTKFGPAGWESTISIDTGSRQIGHEAIFTAFSIRSRSG